MEATVSIVLFIHRSIAALTQDALCPYEDHLDLRT